jgi:hypothetical protein
MMEAAGLTAEQQKLLRHVLGGKVDYYGVTVDRDLAISELLNCDENEVYQVVGGLIVALNVNGDSALGDGGRQDRDEQLLDSLCEINAALNVLRVCDSDSSEDKDEADNTASAEVAYS